MLVLCLDFLHYLKAKRLWSFRLKFTHLHLQLSLYCFKIKSFLMIFSQTVPILCNSLHSWIHNCLHHGSYPVFKAKPVMIFSLSLFVPNQLFTHLQPRLHVRNRFLECKKLKFEIYFWFKLYVVDNFGVLLNKVINISLWTFVLNVA